MLLLMASSLSSAVPNAKYLSVDERPASMHPHEERRRQQRIAEITECVALALVMDACGGHPVLHDLI